MIWNLKSGYPEFAIFSNFNHSKFNDIVSYFNLNCDHNSYLRNLKEIFSNAL